MRPEAEHHEEVGEVEVGEGVGHGPLRDAGLAQQQRAAGGHLGPEVLEDRWVTREQNANAFF